MIGEFADCIREVSLDANKACARAARFGQPVIVEDTETNPLLEPYRPAARSEAFRSVVSAPIITVQDQVLGMASAYFASAHQPTDQELGRLGLYIRQAGDFIERSRAESFDGLSTDA